jgi:hypothetical protein
MSADPGLKANAHTAGGTDFSSSLEAADAQPTWVSTAETDATGKKKMSGVNGNTSTGIPGNIMGKVVEVQASGDNPPNETVQRVVDGDVNTKWLAFAPTGWVQVKLSEPIAVVDYALSSANDAPGRDPRDWVLQGSADGQAWVDLDTRSGEQFSGRFKTRQYKAANTTAYLYYRLNMTANSGDPLIQLAEWQLSNGDTTPLPQADMKSFVSGGPVNGPNMKPNAGFTGLRALQYSGGHTVAGRGYAYNKVFDVDLAVTPASELSYLVFPEFTAGDLKYPSTYVSVDLAFSDGTYLSDLGARDQQDIALNPRDQGASRTLYADQWNRKVAGIGAVAAGKRIKRILVGYDNPSGPGLFNGWIDDIRITGKPPKADGARPSDRVITTRGTNSSGGFSRGNNFPATAVPHGFNFWTPQTDAGSDSWLYEYAAANNAANLPTLQAFAASHEPSPWMGDRQTFQVMPAVGAGVPDANRQARALAFRHENETARAHYYGVTFENGLRTEIAPADHSAMFRFTFPTADANLIFDNVNNNGGLTIDQAAGVVTGYSDVRSGLSTGATRLYVYATFDQPVTASGKLAGGGGPNVTGYVKFAAPSVTMRIATSLLGVDQARRNLEQEIAASDTFDTLRARAQQQWDEQLGIIEVEGANADQLTTLYSNLYRLFLYPNSGYENAGTVLAAGRAEHADGDRCEARRRQGLRQQRLLGHLPHHLARVHPAHPDEGRRDDRRLRAAVQRRGLGVPVVLAGLRQPDDRHEFRRGVRRRLHQGRAQLRRPGRLRRGGPQRLGGAAERRGRAQGPGHVDLPRLHADHHPRGRVVGAGGLHQRLRHREHGEGAGPPGRLRVLPEPGAELRQDVRPVGRLLPGP